MYTFDGANRLIVLEAGTTLLDPQDLYSRWKEWVMTGDNAKWAMAMRPTGGDQITPNETVSPYIFLENGWKIRPSEASHKLTVSGNLFTSDQSNVFVPTIGNYKVEIHLVVSSKSVVKIEQVGTGNDTIQKILEKMQGLQWDINTEDFVETGYSIKTTQDQAEIAAANTQPV